MGRIRIQGKSAYRTLFFGALVLALSSVSVFAADLPAQSFTYQGKFFNASGSAPLTSVVDLTLEIYSPGSDGTAANDCLLYAEKQTSIDLSLSGGMFSVQVGSSVGAPKRLAIANGDSKNDPGLTMAAIFSNKAVALRAPLSSECTPGYSPSSGDARKLRVTVWDGGVPTVLTPDQVINAVPQATNAETLQGVDLSSIIQATGNITSTNLGNLVNGADAGSSLHHHDSLYLKTGGSSSKDLGSGNTYTTGNLGVGTTSPSVSLEIVGPTGSAFKLVDGNQGAGKVLISDADGKATWQSTSSLAGATGASGADGASGATGASGAQGNSGATGASGANGAQGNSGATGASGANGADGNTGASGATGAQGAVGNSGATGASGAQGNSGATGASGANGADGNTGVSGATGAQGAVGNSGATGASGTQGNSGTTGASGAQGNSGATGASGAQGNSGATGASGTDGAVGNTGASGATGAAGAQGNSGATGATGDTGAMGFTGASGATGAQGAVGNSGATGASGAQGNSGATGASGAQGDIGATGASGTQGNSGATGASGAQGNSGATGASGAQGNSGATGASGAQGNSGTTGASGAQGNSGTTGASGAQGMTGATGASGANGADGNTGASGATGAAGAQGMSGATGTTGADGSAGFTGASGATGAQGAVGSSGSTGSSGAPGNSGATGASGAQGLIGATGADGAQGSSGATGATGPTLVEDATFSIKAGTNALADNANSSQYNIAVGYESQKNMRSTAGWGNNISLGFNAIRGSATPASNSGSHNVAFGNSALQNVTSGLGNFAANWNALLSNTSGSYNFAAGIDALRSNTGGSNNVAVGNFALYNNAGGSSNIAVGAEALYTNTAGGNNIGLGYQALKNSTGPSNVAIGYQAQVNMQGDYNIAFGHGALFGSGTPASNTGDRNFAAGFAALNSNSSGSDNFAAGNGALYGNTTGSGNVAIGYQAGHTSNTSNTNTTGSYNTFIGYDAGPGTTTQLSNATAVGKNARVSQSNTIALGGSGSDLVKVGIGTSTPNALLDIAGTASAGNNPWTSRGARLSTAFSSLGWGGYTAYGVDLSPSFDNGGAVGQFYAALYSAPTSTGNGASNLYGLYVNPSASGAGNTAYAAALMGGNVGVGTSTPTATLHVIGPTGAAFRLADGSQGAGKILTSDASGNATWAAASSLAGATGASGTTGATGAQGSIGASGQSGTTGATGASPFSLTGNDAYYTAGNVGIGTTAPSANLTVENPTSDSVIYVRSINNAAALKLDPYPGNSTTRWNVEAHGSPGRLIFRDAWNALNVMTMETGAGANRIYVKSDGNVGIGTAAPAATLHIVGPTGAAFRMVDGNEGAGKILTSDASGNATWSNASSVAGATGATGASPWSLNGSSAYYNAGNVGIGTTNPGYPLEVSQGGAGASPTLVVNATSSQTPVNLRLIPSTSGTSSRAELQLDVWSLRQAVGGGLVKDFDIAQSGTSRLYFNVVGNVGLSDTAPNARLTVREESNSNSITKIATLRRFRADSTAPGVGFGGQLSLEAEGFTNSSVAQAGAVNWGWEGAQSNDTTDRDGFVSFWTSQDDAAAERMRISGSGNVGIGTTSPNATLQVGNQISAAGDNIAINTYWDGGNWRELYSSGASIFGSNGLGTYTYWKVAGPSSVGASITPVTAIAVSTTSGSVGNVGIGTTAPATTLHVVGPTGAAFRLADGNHGAGKILTSDASGNATWSSAVAGATGATGASPFSLNSNDAYYTAGNVGVGTTAPGSTLTVVGNLGVAYPTTNAVIIGNTTGNARGSNALDVQSSRGLTTEVASGSGAVTLGRGNTAAGDDSSAVGVGNSTSANDAVAIGRSNSAITNTGAVAIGRGNTANRLAIGLLNTGSNNGIAIGESNTASADGAIAIGKGVSNSTTGTLQIGPSDSAKLTVGATGYLGVGVTGPSVAVDVLGQIRSRPYNATGSTTIDWNNGNIQHTTDSCGNYTFDNLVDGGSYSFVVKGGTSAQCNFTATGLTFHFTPTNASTTAATHTVYTLFRAGSDVYVSWTTGL